MEDPELVFIHENSEDRITGIWKLSVEERALFIDYVLIQIDKRFDSVVIAVS
jgi:hypothetical protein